MSERIKKFFVKKKTDAAFKLAGPGHKLTDDSSNPTKSTASSSCLLPPKPKNHSEESRLAAEAALLRMQGDKTKKSAVNTSLSPIRAQVKKELEIEKKLQEKNSKATPAPEVIIEAPPHLAVNGVFFRCPIINNEVLPKEEWKDKVKTYLYEQLSIEPGLIACLILQSCNDNGDKVDACVETLCKYMENIIAHPAEEKYHKIRMSNRMFCDKVQPLAGAMEVLHAAGFRKQALTNDAGVEEHFLVFDEANIPTADNLEPLLNALRAAEPVQLELDRNLQVLLPSQAAERMELPRAFYSLTPQEIKKEQQLKSEEMEENLTLKTKAMREKEQLSKIRKYKYAIIRIRFPDLILLQGTFSICDKVSDIVKFVIENLEHPCLPFILISPTGVKIPSEEKSDKTLTDLCLVPATILTFSWDSSAAEDVAKLSQKGLFLKPEIMELVQKI